MTPLEPALLDRLFAAADTVRGRAHAPYSRFSVGAALLTTAGTIHAGCNVENAAYPQGACAEAGAISAMVAAGETAIRAVAIVGGPVGAAGPLVTPCGGCRQRLREFATADTQVFGRDEAGRVHAFTFAELLPHAFGPEVLP